MDHIVSAAEAWESGASQWTEAKRREFGADRRNLTAARDCVNRSKGASDLAEWSGTIATGPCAGTALTADGRRFLAARTLEVKLAWDLDMDPAEAMAVWDVLTE